MNDHDVTCPTQSDLRNDPRVASSPARRSSGSFGLLLGILLSAFAMTLLFPLLSRNSTVAVARLGKVSLAGPADTIAVFGNSVASHVSKCDEDRRTLAGMLGSLSGRPVIDISRPGQSFQEAVNLAGLALAMPNISDVVVFLSPFQLTQGYTLPATEQVVFRLLGPQLGINRLTDRLRQGVFLRPEVDVDNAAFTYGGVTYPEGNDRNAIFLAREKRANGCPEHLGLDHRFIEAAYWNGYLRSPPRHGNVEALRDIRRLAEERGKRLVVILLPIDIDDIRTLNVTLSEQIRRRVAALGQDLIAADIGVTDLSLDRIPPEEFADRWCACGHLQDTARRTVADATVRSLVTAASPPQHPTMPEANAGSRWAALRTALAALLP